MSRRLFSRASSPALLVSAASPVRGWFVRLVPLAVVALLGCTDDKLALGIDDSSSSGDDTAADDTAADDTATGDTAGPVVPGGEPIAGLTTECELRFSCDCTYDRFADIAACEEHYMVEWAGILGKAQAAGLTADLECYLGSLPYENYACDSYTEYAEQQASQEPQACSSCQFAHGDRQVGESCQAFGEGVGDCAQGLQCMHLEPGVWQCVDPCSHAGVGESCAYFPCADGLACDWADATCRPAGGDGELCADGSCDDGLLCQWDSNTCRQPVGLGEACTKQPCGAGLSCDGQVCVAPPGPGESCEFFACADGFVCQWADMTCTTPGQEGESCASRDCAPGLACDAALLTCAPPAALGEACDALPCGDGLICDWQTLTCAEIPELGEPCSDTCADGLLCNYGASPAVCAPLPGEGEPCIWDSCGPGLACDVATQKCAQEPAIVCGL